MDTTQPFKLKGASRRAITDRLMEILPFKPAPNERPIASESEGYVYYPDENNTRGINNPIRMEDFPYQCGANVVANFPADDTMNEQARLELALIIRDFEDADLGMLVATVNPDQEKTKQVLLDLGWKTLATFNNPNTGNNNTLLGLVLRDEE